MHHALALQLLENNEEPNDSQRKVVEDMLKSHVHVIADEVRREERSATSGSQSTLESIQLYSAYSRILSPTRKLPNEVLEFIFRNILDDQELEVIVGRHSSAFSSVCRRWRVAAQPLLPSAGTFCVPHGTVSSGTRTKEIMAQFALFTQALPSPADSHFSLVIIDNLSTPANLDNSLMKALFAQCHRWISLTMAIDPLIFHQVTAQLKDCVHSLQILKLNVNPREFVSYFNLFESATALRHVELVVDSASIVQLPYNRLYSYREQSLGYTNGATCLRHGKTLKKLEHIVQTTPTVPFHLNRPYFADEPVNIERLDLRIYNANFTLTQDKQTTRRLHTIHCALPHLNSIRLRDPNRNPVFSLTAIIEDSFNGPSPLLTKLAIHGLPWTPGQLDALLQLTPNLTYLECSDIPSIDLFLLSRKKPMRAPQLDTLIIHDASDVRDVQQAVTGRNSSRSLGLGTHSPLSTVRLLYRDPHVMKKRSTQFGIPQQVADPLLQENLQRLTVILGGGKGRLWKRYGVIRPVKSSFKWLTMPTYSLKEDVDTIIDTLHSVDISEPHSMELIHVHMLHSLLLLRPFKLDQESSSARLTALLAKWIAAFQSQFLKPLYADFTPRWIAIAPYCIALRAPLYSQKDQTDISIANNIWSYVPTEYDVLYGRYRPPTAEEVLWVHDDCLELTSQT